MSDQPPVPTAKLQEPRSTSPSADKVAKPSDPAAKGPAALEEDDEFEDFPVEGALRSQLRLTSSLEPPHPRG